jgi:hypothetical protein
MLQGLPRRPYARRQSECRLVLRLPVRLSTKRDQAGNRFRSIFVGACAMATPQDAAAEKRNFKRWQLIFYLRVFDQDTGSLLGHIIDISEGGMMLISEQPLPIDQMFRLYLEVPQDTGPRQHIEFEALSLWSKNDINPDFYDTGFRIIRLTPYALGQLRLLIADFKSEFKLTD